MNKDIDNLANLCYSSDSENKEEFKEMLKLFTSKCEDSKKTIKKILEYSNKPNTKIAKLGVINILKEVHKTEFEEFIFKYYLLEKYIKRGIEQ